MGSYPLIAAQVTLKYRANLSVHQLFAACRFTARIGDVESEHQGQPFGPFWGEILHNALGVATLSVASIESFANELYFEGGVLTPGVNEATASIIAELLETTRESIPRKYALALAIRTGKSLDHGIAQVQNADALISFCCGKVWGHFCGNKN